MYRAQYAGSRSPGHKEVARQHRWRREIAARPWQQPDLRGYAGSADAPETVGRPTVRPALAG